MPRIDEDRLLECQTVLLKCYRNLSSCETIWRQSATCDANKSVRTSAKPWEFFDFAKRTNFRASFGVDTDKVWKNSLKLTIPEREKQCRHFDHFSSSSFSTQNYLLLTKKHLFTGDFSLIFLTKEMIFVKLANK